MWAIPEKADPPKSPWSKFYDLLQWKPMGVDSWDMKFGSFDMHGFPAIFASKDGLMDAILRSA